MVVTLSIIVPVGVSAENNHNQNRSLALKFYGKYISPVDGDRCPMYPTCSTYAAQAVKKHGLFMGWIMACDRLIRCGRDETHISPAIIKDKAKLTLDPVSANDFWWYSQHDQTN